MDKRLHFSETSRFEQLPDELLLLILSFLAAADVVRTSILSRRWRNLWRFNTCWDFDATYMLPKDLLDTNRKWYIAWVDKVFEARASVPGLPPIKELRIRYKLEKRQRRRIDRWISFAITNRVEALHLDLAPYLGVVSKSCLYKLSEESWYKAPSGLSSLKCLKSLFLSSVNVSKQFIEFILSSCPLLEDLSLRFAGEYADLDVSGVPPLQLRRLKIDAAEGSVLTNLCAPYLKSFYYMSTGFDPQNIYVPMLTDLTIGGKHGSPRIMKYLRHFWNYLPQLEKLDLIMEKPQKFRLRQMPELVKLRYLKLRFSWGDTDPIFYRIANFMNACPLLETFAFEIFDGDEIPSPLSTPRYGRKQKWQKVEKNCSFKSLKVVELYGAEGKTIDQEVVKFVISKAPNLERLNIHIEIKFIHSFFYPSERKIVRLVKSKAIKLCKGSPTEIKIKVIG